MLIFKLVDSKGGFLDKYRDFRAKSFYLELCNENCKATNTLHLKMSNDTSQAKKHYLYVGWGGNDNVQGKNVHLKGRKEVFTEKIGRLGNENSQSKHNLFVRCQVKIPKPNNAPSV